MNYYEELGLSRTASTEEIRQAYKSLAWLLHPDRQTDANLRKMAELQMMRLNEVQTTLTEPALRARYDATLRTKMDGPAQGVENSPPSRVFVKLHTFQTGKVRPGAGAVVWSIILMAAASGFAFMFVYLEHDSGMVVYRTPEDVVRPAPSPTPRQEPARIAPPQSKQTSSTLPVQTPSRPVHRNQQPAVRAQTLAPAGEPAPPKPDTISNASQDPVQKSSVEAARPAAPSIPLAAGAPKPAPVSREPLIGTWLYVKPQTEEAGSKNFSYRPEYIEMVIKARQKGQVSGRYKAQFHVPDRPISSEVTFQFEGPASEGSNVFAWRGDDGASGQIRMKMVSDGVMEVSWYTTRFGSAQKLASGTAVLYRD